MADNQPAAKEPDNTRGGGLPLPFQPRPPSALLPAAAASAAASIAAANGAAAPGGVHPPPPPPLPQRATAPAPANQRPRRARVAGPTAAAAADPPAVNPSTDLTTNLDPTVASPGCLDQHEQNANTMHLFLHRVAGNFSSAALQTLHDDQGTLSPEQRQAHLTAVAADLDARTATLKASLPIIVAKHQAAIDPSQHLASCAACGVRQMYPDTPYTRHTLAEMRILQFNATDSPADAAKQLRIESAGEYGVVFSYFDDDTTVPPTRWHLHREFVDAPGPLTDATDPSALLCGTCTKDVGNFSRPTNSIAAGIDYGCLQRYFHDHGAPLTDLELAAISCARVVQTIIKVSGANAGRGQQLASRAQSVVVLQPTGPEVLFHVHGCERKLRLHPSFQCSDGRPDVDPRWKFEYLGTGGLAEQFRTMSCRAFISRIMPPGVR